MEHVEELKPIEGLRNPVLLTGFRVQERAGRLAARCINHLVDQWRAEAVAEIDMAPFLDLAFNRPQIQRTETESSITWPVATLYLTRSAAPDRDLLLFSSAEPNFRWPTFVETLASYVQHLGVQTLVTMRAHPGVVPHTRPAPVYLTAMGRDLRLLFGVQANEAKYEGPSSIAGVLAARSQALGWDTAELAVVQPDYFPRMPCAEAMISLFTLIDKALGTTTSLDTLRETASAQREMLDGATSASEEARVEVENRERSYDQGALELEFLSPSQTPSDLPAAEEVVEAIERFFRHSESED
jgi:predicted ATP-grasp superfamily ATP-dependent carboligase